ncbi:MAG: DUF4965 domain-containing protein [Clostridia bacterium]|nr:DUF4965 domain-containing protein [Clostridia bacterium]
MREQYYPAVPLITCDPYFNVWSMTDKLYDDFPRHWTGMQNPITGTVSVDGEEKNFMGMKNHNPYYPNCNKLASCAKTEYKIELEQKSVTVTPLKTVYTFADDKIELTVTFMTPLLPDDLNVLSRPVSFMSYSIRSIDGKKHDISVYVDVSAMLAVDTANENVVMGREDGFVYCSSGTADMLKASGDDKRISWGRVCLASPGAILGTTVNDEKNLNNLKNINHDNEIYRVSDKYPVIFALKEYKDSDVADGFVCFAYDDVYSLEYFGKKIKGYWTKDGMTFAEMLKDSINRFGELSSRADEFDCALMAKAEKIGSDYAKLIAVSYRQVIGAHKLAWDGSEGVFVSKECFSNGCAATVDVTYPSFPMFIIYNTDLAEFMLNPIFKLIDEGKWPFEFAPHDAGRYPLVNGQVYGLSDQGLALSSQMPVEECGNMLLCVAAICKKREDTSYAEKHFDLLNSWAEYLVKYGYDPDNQLCTDDFAGHLAHNCNLSVKAIMGIAAWGMLLDMMGKENDFAAKAKEYAARWKKDAFDKDHYKLTFDKEDTWSIKYNLVWDKLFGMGIFDEDIFETEVEYYKKHINRYGLPLDSRAEYTKSDWQMWSTVLCDDKEYTDMICSAMIKMLYETPDRAPFTDWYYTNNARCVAFRNRTVQGGLFINMLEF